MYMYPNSFEIQLSIFSSPLQEDISVVTIIEVKKSRFLIVILVCKYICE